MDYDFSPFAEKYQQSTVKNYVIPNWVIIVAAVLSLFASFWLNYPLYFISIVAIYIFAQRSGHREGYVEGVDDGVAAAIEKKIQIK